VSHLNKPIKETNLFWGREQERANAKHAAHKVWLRSHGGKAAGPARSDGGTGGGGLGAALRFQDAHSDNLLQLNQLLQAHCSAVGTHVALRHKCSHFNISLTTKKKIV
jgi:hypothetical protein